MGVSAGQNREWGAATIRRSLGVAQVMVVVDKDDAGALTKRELFGVMYVPLTTPDRQLEDAG